ncbi:uncharacterized protein LOC122509862 [Leptopilina heterotoma]|uniref:uncharacterized protein LOC122509862 n=1 Tax=Leptopilina heterotoma TaxID=63436 RepID=UPI001CA98F73|nr:uncharacterized protein LOC122509862 [Leptopilina heterotoma]
MESGERKIKLISENNSCFIVVKENRLKKAVLNEYYPNGSTITYKENEDVCLLETDETFIHLNPGVDEYYVKLNKDCGTQNDLGGAKRKTLTIKQLLFSEINFIFLSPDSI